MKIAFLHENENEFNVLLLGSSESGSVLMRSCHGSEVRKHRPTIWISSWPTAA